MGQSDEALVISPSVTDEAMRQRAIKSLRKNGIRLPSFAQLSGDEPVPQDISDRLKGTDPDSPDWLNLWRVNWFNAPDRKGRVEVPAHIVLPPALTGVKAPIVALLGSRFPMIGAHKVLPAYAGLVSLLVTGRFDPATHRAIWPSTGNYCRGGVAISRIMGCDGVAVLPEGMSRERYDWLEQWVSDPASIVRTYGTESNVKEIYDKCHELAAIEGNVILNQFSAFSNYMSHHACTGGAFARVYEALPGKGARSHLAAFVSATGSAGTIGAGDLLKDRYGTQIVAVEALECPTMLENGYGEHNIQGIGDKHIPLIHNVMNTDFVIGISDRASDQLNLLCNTDTGRAVVAALGLTGPEIASLAEIGISGFANIVAAIRLARYMDYGPDDVVMTVATDSARMYGSEAEAARAHFYPDGFDEDAARQIVATHLHADNTEHVLQLTQPERRRVFNLGYYTWVEQQGVDVADFDRRKDQAFWGGIAASVPEWDRLIKEFNAEVAG